MTQCADKPPGRRSRQHPRAEVSLPVIVCTPRGQIQGRIINLSLTGAFILLGELPDLTSQVELFIEIPRLQVLVVIAAIVRFDIRPSGDGARHHFGLAVRFSNIADDDRVLLSTTFLS
ncbi:MAG TPA: PilZ domain-containing protein [Syntrophobacteria bacterium]|nr:PilZ domain-containing protein [Syntrophobacteria bacterium]